MSDNRSIRVFALFLCLACPPAGVAQDRIAPNATARLGELSAAFQSLSGFVSPAVVQVVTTGYGAAEGADAGTVNLQRGGGSGVIVDASGYIVTSGHVVEGARQVRVLLATGPADAMKWHSILKPQGRMLPARIVGSDDETDLAVLKIDAGSLPSLRLGDSDALRQGQLVFAFGSPLGLDNSVSMGVVSSVARQLRPGDPMIYVQTDAPINPGNSGGPLVDTEGNVVGINTFIFTRSGGSEGLGFAAPSNIVKNVLEQIRKTGRVRRGHIGAMPQTITAPMATALKLPRASGAILSDVFPGGPADFAGLKIGDIVLTVDGKPVENARQLEVNVYRHAPGDTISVDVQRGTEHLAATVQVMERPDDPERFADLVGRDAGAVNKLGILALDVDEKTARLLPPLRKPAAILVAARLPEDLKGGEILQPGDLISAINGEPLGNLAGLRARIDELPPGAPVVLQVQRQGRLMFVTFELP